MTFSSRSCIEYEFDIRLDSEMDIFGTVVTGKLACVRTALMPAWREIGAGRQRPCCYSDHHPCNGKGRSVTRRRAWDGEEEEEDGGEGPASWIRPPWGEHTPWPPCMTGCHIIGLARLCTTTPSGQLADALCATWAGAGRPRAWAGLLIKSLPLIEGWTWLHV